MTNAPAASAHVATLDRLLAGGSSQSLKQIFQDVSDEFWLWAFTEGYRTDARLRALLPEFPPEDVQYRFTGAAGDQTLREAFDFYCLVRRLVHDHRREPLTTALEFGCGWGRIIRLFLRDVDGENLWGVDCMPQAIDICQDTNRSARFQRIEPFPPSGLPANTFDLVYAYSVFSHLSEEAHDRWLQEFREILRPGGLLVLTTRPREFILMCAELRSRQEARDWAQGAVLAFRDTESALQRFDRGEFMFEPLGGGDVLDKSFYGETCIPRSYVERHWTRYFEFVDFIDDRSRFLQNVAVVRRR
jgi:SAM-dependent methyltransferase